MSGWGGEYYGMPVINDDGKRITIKLDGVDSDYCYDPAKADQCALVVERTVYNYGWKVVSGSRKAITVSHRILTGHGASGARVGDSISWITDTGLGHRYDHVGRYRIVGIVEPDGSRSGHIPNRKLPHFVMK